MKIDYNIFNQKTAIDRFIFAVENGFYVEAHELLEDDWNFYKKQGELNKALVLKGLINGATALALYHIKKRPLRSCSNIYCNFRQSTIHIA